MYSKEVCIIQIQISVSFIATYDKQLTFIIICVTYSYHHQFSQPENIICVAKTGTRIKIIDFGLAQRYDSFSSTKVMAGTIDFMSPEVCNYEDVTPATDMWSVGVICYVL